MIDMAVTVSILDLNKAIEDELRTYSDEITQAQKKAVDTVADEVNAEIKSHISFKQHTGKYVKSFRLKMTKDTNFGSEKTWYVAAPEYRLTHLLEKGHAAPGGGRTKAFPHIQFGQVLAEKRMMELSEEAINNAGH